MRTTGSECERFRVDGHLFDKFWPIVKLIVLLSLSPKLCEDNSWTIVSEQLVFTTWVVGLFLSEKGYWWTWVYNM